VHAKTTTTPVDPFDAQNNIEPPIVVGQNNNSLPIVVEPIQAQNIIRLPIVVARAHQGTK
jgi:hypothetical protein